MPCSRCPQKSYAQAQAERSAKQAEAREIRRKLSGGNPEIVKQARAQRDRRTR